MSRVPRDLRAVLLVALRAQAGRGPHAEAARQVILAVLLAQMLAGVGATTARRTRRAGRRGTTGLGGRGGAPGVAGGPPASRVICAATWLIRRSRG